MTRKGVTITVDGARVFVSRDAEISDLSDAEYAELERSCEAEEHPEGQCPLCVEYLQDTLEGYGAGKDGKDYVSDLWGSWSSEGWTAQSASAAKAAMTAKLVQAHKVVKSFVDTFATDKLAFDVTFDESVGTAGTNVRGRKVVISPAPAQDPTLDAAQAGLVLTGMSVHEASHFRYARNSAAAIQKAIVVGAIRTTNAKPAHDFANILDDIRIEDRFSREYPGYAHVFGHTLDYVATADIAKNGPWVPRVDRPVDLALAATRYPTYATWTPETEAERDWWQDWGRRWSAVDSPKQTVSGVLEAIAHAQQSIANPPQPEPEPDQSQGGRGEGEGQPTPGRSQDGQAPAPSPSRSDDEQDDDQDDDQQDAPGASGDQDEAEQQDSRDAESAGDEDPSTGDATGVDSGAGITLVATTRVVPCVSDAVAHAAEQNGVKPWDFSGKTAQEAVNLASVTKTANGYTGAVRWAREAGGRPLRVPADRSVERAVRAAFLRSRSGHTAIDHGQKRGRLDNRSLYRVARGDVRVFHRRHAPSPGKYRFWLMVDCSSSMTGGGWGALSPIESTIACAKAIVAAARYTPTMRAAVFGWTTPSGHDARFGHQFAVYKAWETGMPIDKIDDLGRVPTAGTPDLFTLAWAVSAIKDDCGRDEQPIVVMLSDGGGYGHEAMKPVVDAARRDGVEVIGVEIGREYGHPTVKTYGESRAIEWKGSIAESARPLGELIARITGTASSTGRAA